MLIPAVVGLSVAGALAHGAFHRNSPVFGPALGRLPTRERRISLTFDDGPNPIATPMILDTLSQFGVRATFFMVGKYAELWPELVQRVAREGHQIGNHGYFHQSLAFRSPRYIDRDVFMGTRGIEHAVGRSPRYFRAPHGFRNPWVSWIAGSYGQRTIGWSLGVWDSDAPGVKKIVRRVIRGARPGSILLLHDGDGENPNADRTQTARALPHIISEMRDRGFAFTTLPS
jgi:peptidoglycan/xylan/chitin deacetylase (PgdA/CDA1 family)